MTWQGCGALAAAKRLVFGGSGVYWVFETCSGGVVLGLALYVVVPGLLVMVLGRAEQGTLPSSTITWRRCGEVRRMERGMGGRAGGGIEVSERS